MPRTGSSSSSSFAVSRTNSTRTNSPRSCRRRHRRVLLAFADITGACERIRNRSILLSYRSYVKYFVRRYALVTPFCTDRSDVRLDELPDRIARDTRVLLMGRTDATAPQDDA